MDSFYREEILEHYRTPSHFGQLQKYTQSSKLVNVFCGDEIELFLNISGNTIEDISFTGKGCAISIAASSMLTEYLFGKTVVDAQTFLEKDMLTLLDIPLSESRKKCALLGWAAMREIVEKQ